MVRHVTFAQALEPSFVRRVMAPEHAGFAVEMAKWIGWHPAMINGVLLVVVQADVTHVAV